MADLKLKRNKCNFFKCELHCIGDLISGKGIYNLPEKLHSIESLTVPKMPKDVRQMLGLTGHYCKLICDSTNLIRPLTQLNHRTVPFISMD